MLEGYDDLPTVENAKHDRIRIEIGNWEFKYRNNDDLVTFAALLCPPTELERVPVISTPRRRRRRRNLSRFRSNCRPTQRTRIRRRRVSPAVSNSVTERNPLAQFGWIFRAGGNRYSETNAIELNVRNEIKNLNEAPPPIFSGTAKIHRNNRDRNATEYTAKMRALLDLNPTRFARYQLCRDKLRISANSYPLPRTGEYCLNNDDNVLYLARDNPLYYACDETYWSNPENWQYLLSRYFDLVTQSITQEVNRSWAIVTSQNAQPEFKADYNLKRIEVYWEVSFPDSLEELDRIAPIIRRFGIEVIDTKYFQSIDNYNGRGFKIPMAKGSELSVYCKTNKRIRFEVRFDTTKYYLTHTSSQQTSFSTWCQ